MNIMITEAEAGKTIFTLTREVMGFSSAMLKRLKFSPGGILVNGAFVTVRYELKLGDVLSLAVEDTEEDVSPYIIPVDLPLEVLYEDEHLCVINKPPDMPAHPSLGHQLDTAANALAFHYGDKPYVFRPVNRLDRDTSGVMLTSNTKLAAYRMFLAMQGGDIHKSYIAVTEGMPAVPAGRVEGYMRREADSIIRRCVCEAEEPGAQHAVTEYRTLYSDGRHSVILASPLTGRTHQIRVQLTSIGCPLAGDTLYGGDSPYIARQALHAIATEFPHPAGGRRRIHAPLPADMRTLITALFPEQAESVFEEVSAL